MIFFQILQVVPVVTQPQLLFPNSCMPVSGGYIMPTGKSVVKSNHFSTADGLVNSFLFWACQFLGQSS